MKMWDSQKMASLVTHQDKLQKELADVSDSLHQEYNSDEWATDDGGKMERYSRDQLRHAQITRELNTVNSEIGKLENFRPETITMKKNASLTRFLQRGYNGLEADEIKLQQEFPDDDSAVLSDQYSESGYQRFVITPESDGLSQMMPQMSNDGLTDATRSDDTSGEVLNPLYTRPSVIDSLKYYGGIARMAYNFSTGVGNEYRLPQHDDTSQEGELLAVQNTEVDQTEGGKLNNFEFVRFDASTMSSKPIYITREMLNDSIIDIAGFANQRVVRRLGRGWDKQFMTGGSARLTGKGTAAAAPEPTTGMLGILKCALVKARTTATTLKISHADLVNAIYDVDRAYREGGEMGEGGLMAEMGGRTGFLISDEVEKILCQTVDGDNRPLWLPAWTSSIGPSPKSATILGYPYEVGSNLPAMAANSRSWMFGNFSYFGLRMVAAIEIFRFQDSRTMQRNAIEILGFSRRYCRPMVKGSTGADPEANSKFAYLGIPQVVLQKGK